jgi:hypothetical protein
MWPSAGTTVRWLPGMVLRRAIALAELHLHWIDDVLAQLTDA